MLPDSYLEVLGSKDPFTQLTKEVIDEEDEVAQLISDKQKTLARAMKAATEGDAEEASYLFRLHSKMLVPSATSNTSQNHKVDVTITKVETQDVVLETDEEKPFVENGITFMPGTYIIDLHCPNFNTNINIIHLINC